MSRLLFESRAAVLACEAKQALTEKEIELEKLKQQRKQWVGLTEDEIRKCFFRDDVPPSSPPYWWEYRDPDYTAIYALIDKALREKNA